MEPQGRRVPECALPPGTERGDHPAGVEHAEGNAEQRAEDGLQRAVGEQHAAHQLLVAAAGQHDPGFGGPALDGESQQHPGQPGARRHQEHAQSQEELAEVGGPLRSLERQLTERREGEAGGPGRQLRQQGHGVGVPELGEVRAGGRRHTNGGRPVCVRPLGGALPHRLNRSEADEGLGRRPIASPILVIPVRDAVEVHRERRVPVAHTLGVGHAFEVRGKLPVRARPGDFHDVSKGELHAPRGVRPVIGRHKVVELQLLPDLAPQILRRPRVQPRLALARYRLLARDRPQSRHHRVSQLA